MYHTHKDTDTCTRTHNGITVGCVHNIRALLSDAGSVGVGERDSLLYSHLGFFPPTGIPQQRISLAV